MNSKAKFVFSISSLCLVIAMTIITIVAVFAAQIQTINSNVNVTYTATNVAGVVSATYQTKTGTEINMVDTAHDNAASVTLASADAQGTNTLAPTGNIVLDSDNEYVVFKYSFVNTNTNAYYATLSYTDTSDDDANVTVTYSTDGTEYGSTNNTLTVAGITGEDTETEPIYYYVKVAISDTSLNSIFSGQFSWSLSVTQ